MSFDWIWKYAGDFVFLRTRRLFVNGTEVLPANGTVTSVGTGTGLTGGPITTTGTVSLANTAVTAASYTLMSATVDAQGRLTAASNGAAVTSVATGTGLTGGPINTTGTVSLANTAVTPGTYSIPTITINAQGQITSAVSVPLAIFTLNSGTNTTNGRYILPTGQATTFEGGALLASRAGNVTSLTCRCAVAPGVGTSRTFTLYKNAIATAMTVTISGASTTGSVVVNVAVSALDQVALLHTSAGVPAASITQATLEFLP